VLDIVTHSLYTDREVFLRELISNASDALEKARHVALSESTGVDSGHPLEVKIEVDSEAKTLTITDSGIGMSREDLVSHLGTIARSGTKAFLNSLKESKAEAGGDGLGMIGKFGVGFYASFMVADKVQVVTRSALPDSQGFCWESSGDGRFSISEHPAAERGTKIVLHLKEDASEFASESKVKEVVKKYSNFVAHPILLGDERINTVQALWARTPKDVTEEEHKEFFKFVSGSFGDPAFYSHFVADAPLSIKALFYVPKFNAEKFGLGARDENRMALYSRKVLIQQKNSKLLPEYLRFVTGVVDCEDIPLNISRETMQDSALMAKLQSVLTNRVIKFLADKAKSDPEEYDKFFTEFGMAIKEGVCTERSNDHKSKLAPLLRCETSAEESGKAVSLDDYVERCPEDQDQIYYICAPSREMAVNSAYMESFNKSNTEVLFLYGQADEFVMSHLKEYKGKKIVNVESEGITLPKSKETAEEEKVDEKESSSLTKAETDQLCSWIQDTLGSAKVKGVRTSSRLVDSPAMIVGHQSAAERRLHQMQMQMVAGHKDAAGLGINFDAMGPVGTLEINPAHPILKQLSTATLSHEPRKKELAEAIIWQVFDNARIAAGVLDDPRSMLARLNTILAAAMQEDRAIAASGEVDSEGSVSDEREMK